MRNCRLILPLLLLCASTATPSRAQTADAPRDLPAAVGVPQLILDERYHASLPSNLRVSGGMLDSGGTILLWSRTAPGVLQLERGVRRTLCGEVWPIAAAIVSAGQIEVVDRQGNIYASNASSCVRGHGLGTEAQVVAASHSARGWLFALLDMDARASLVLRASNSTQDTVVAASDSTLNDIRIRSSQLLTTTDHILVSSMMWPFSWHALTPDGTNEFVSQPFALDTVFTTLLDTARATSLVSLGVLPIGQGYIQVLSDSRSDLRVMVIYRKDGTKVRALPIATAMGLIATSADSEEVLAIRKTDILEAVRYAYKWNWVAPGDLHRR